MKRNYKCSNGHVFEIKYERLVDVEGERKCPECGLTASVVFEKTPIHFHSTGFTKRVR